MQKITIVEDDEFLREELENIYHKAGYEVCCVTDFPETGAVCEAEHPDLLVRSGTSGNQWICTL